MSEPLLSVRDLTVQTTRNDRELYLVDGVSFDLQRGEALGIVGESGSGKSLTLRALLGLLPQGVRIASGTVTFNGKELTSMSSAALRHVRGREMAMVFQDPMTALNPVMPVGEQIGEGPRAHLGLNRRQASNAALDLMRRVGIPDVERRARAYPHEFSGGMRQRVMIAIALSCSPQLLLCDEPTTALDVTIQQQILDLIDELRIADELAVLFVTHDLAVVAQLCERVAVMYGGRVVESGTTDEVFRRPCHGYTLGLLRSAPDLRVLRDRLETIPGLPPDPAERPVGCSFAPRCGFVDEVCADPARVTLRRAKDGHECACARCDVIARAVAEQPVVADA